MTPPSVDKLPPIPGVRAAGRVTRKLIGRVVRPARKPAGSAPGTLVHTGPRVAETVRVTRLRYGAGTLEEDAHDSLDDRLLEDDGASVVWLNVDGLHDASILDAIDVRFGVHRLVLEDVLSIHQRPKVEAYDGYFFAVVKMLDFDEESRCVTVEQVSFIVGERFLFSFQERSGDVFDPVRERLRGGKGRIRGRGVDYLAYALIDAVVDRYFLVLERIGDRIEQIEEEAMNGGSSATIHAIHDLRREILVLRRAVWPLRDALALMYRGDVEGIHEDTRLFLRDVHDHTVQVIDTIESLRELLSAAMDLHLSSVSNRMNEVMKVLTIIATIFIPLSFFAGVYGMNFEHMPELSWPWAYPALLGFMLVIALGMIGFFKRKDWL